MQEEQPSSRMQPILDHFEQSFLIPLEQDSVHSMLVKARELDSNTMQW